MNDLPDIAICLLTCKRTDEALRTIHSTFDNLVYPEHKIGLYIADDGSPKEHFEAVKSAIQSRTPNLIGYHNEKLRHKGQESTFHAGMGWNRGLGICHQYSDFILVLEDDWELDEKLELEPYIRLLQEREEVGACSFRILSVGADVHTVGHDGRMYLRYDRTTQYAFSGNPYIRHARYTKHYGWFPEDRNPGLMELHQDDLYRYREVEEGKMALRDPNDNSPQIWRPVGISQWGAWKHIGSNKTWS